MAAPLEAITGLRVVPVASNRVQIMNNTGTMLLDIYDLPANLGMEISTYLAGGSEPRCTLDISVNGDHFVQEVIDLLLEGAKTDGAHHKQYFITEALKILIPKYLEGIEIDDGTPP